MTTSLTQTGSEIQQALDNANTVVETTVTGGVNGDTFTVGSERITSAHESTLLTSHETATFRGEP